jgi:hypothetical protein
MSERTERILRAKALLTRVRNAAMATVNDDGSPHNTPFHYIIDDAREYIYMASAPEAVHTQNLLRTGNAFIVIYAENEADGLYMEARNARQLSADDLEAGLQAWNAQRAKEGKAPLDSSLFTGDSPQRMYHVELVRFWVNNSERNAEGSIIRDYRFEIERSELL